MLLSMKVFERGRGEIERGEDKGGGSGGVVSSRRSGREEQEGGDGSCTCSRSPSREF